MKRKNIEQTAVSLASMTGGAMVSRLVADKLPIKDSKLKRGALIVASFLAAAALDRKTTGKAVVQDMAISSAVTQTGYLIKEVVADKMQEDSIFKPALGNPGSYYNPITLNNSYEFFEDNSPAMVSYEEQPMTIINV